MTKPAAELIKIKRDAYKHLNLKIFLLNKDLLLPQDSLKLQKTLLGIISHDRKKLEIYNPQFEKLYHSNSDSPNRKLEFYYLNGNYILKGKKYEFSATIYPKISNNTILVSHNKAFQRD
jgi:hypothetical protein